MKLNGFVMVALLAATALLPSVASASLLTSGTTSFSTTGGALKADVRYAVYDHVSANPFGVTLDKGELGYFYQIVNDASASQRIEVLEIGLDPSNPLPTGFTSFSNVDIDGNSLAATIAPAPNGFHPGVSGVDGSVAFFNFPDRSAGLAPGTTSDVLHFVATNLPVNSGSVLRNPTTITGFLPAPTGAPVPVPVPPALALLLAGVPFARFLRARKA